jgi:uncharacterized protein (TIGR04255 family)
VKPVPPLQLPSFDNPPLAEVVVGIQFERIPALTSARIGELWRQYAKEYPKTEDQAPLPPIRERFETSGPQPILFQVQAGYQTPRVWLISEDSTRLLQIQPDRFIFNWRKSDDENKYPRFSVVKDTFFKELKIFVKYLDTHKIGDLNVMYCEVSYINHIKPNELWKTHADVGVIFPTFAKLNRSTANIELEESGFNILYHILDASKKPVGRLRIVNEPRYIINPQQPIYHLDLTARGYPLGERDIAGVEKFIDVAHREIVTGFVSVTSDKMHKIWERTDVATN